MSNINKLVQESLDFIYEARAEWAQLLHMKGTMIVKREDYWANAKYQMRLRYAKMLSQATQPARRKQIRMQLRDQLEKLNQRQEADLKQEKRKFNNEIKQLKAHLRAEHLKEKKEHKEK